MPFAPSHATPARAVGKQQSSSAQRVCSVAQAWQRTRLLHAGANAATDNNEPLRRAAKRGHTAVVKALLALPPARGVDPAAVDMALLYDYIDDIDR